MHLRTVGVGASVALVANAILLPPGISSTTSEPANALVVRPNHHVVQVECDACPFAEADPKRGVVWTEGRASSLMFEFNTGDHHDVLNINGAQMFPPTMSLIPEAVFVHQVPAGVDPTAFMQHNPRFRVTGYEFRFDAADTITEEGDELLPMTFTVHSIAGLSIPKQTLRIFVVKDAQGNLGVAHVNAVQEEPSEEGNLEGVAAECAKWPMLCRLREIMSSKLRGMKNSLRKGGCSKVTGLPALHGENGHSDHHARPHGGPPHGPHDGHHRDHHHHRHGKFHRFTHIVGHFILRILVPVLVGIAAGIVTYLVGMVVGATIALIWMKMRNRRSQYQAVALDEEDASPDDLFHDAVSSTGVYMKNTTVIDNIAEVEGEAPPAYADLHEKEVVEHQK